MTTITETARRGAQNRLHAGIWHSAVHALGKLWAKVIALPDASANSARRKAPPPVYFNFPPF